MTSILLTLNLTYHQFKLSKCSKKILPAEMVMVPQSLAVCVTIAEHRS